MKKMQSGFTLIELVMVIVILGILAASALPKFVDLSSEANTAADNGVWGAAQSSVAISYAAQSVGKDTDELPGYDATDCAGGYIADGDCLFIAMGSPDGWEVEDTTSNCDTANGGTSTTVGGCICRDGGSTAAGCTEADDVVISVTTAEADGVKAVIAKDW